MLQIKLLHCSNVCNNLGHIYKKGTSCEVPFLLNEKFNKIISQRSMP